MGCTSFFYENVTKDGSTKCTPHQIDVLDNHSASEIVIGPIDNAHEGLRASFNDSEQFKRFAEAVNSLKHRLEGLHK